MDKSQEMFENPPIPTKGYQKGVLLNTLLSYDENYIYCGEYNFTYENFKEIFEMHGQEDCTLLDEKTVEIEGLFDYLLVDFSFHGTQKIGHLL